MPDVRTMAFRGLTPILGLVIVSMFTVLVGTAFSQTGDSPPSVGDRQVTSILATAVRVPRPRPDPGPSPFAIDDAEDGRDLVCSLIERESAVRSLPPMFLARLIWKESLFRPTAISPKGAEGIAQFMPETAAERGLADSFDVTEAIPHSASYLKDLHDAFGNLGLAAAAYNAGPDRVIGWIAGERTLPFETQDYVSFITGISAEKWKAKEASDADLSWQDVTDFQAECLEFRPVVVASAAPSAEDAQRGFGVRASNFAPLTACVQGRLCSMRVRR